MVLIPRGIDQGFWQRESSLVPECLGTFAEAARQVPQARKQFRERCMVLFANLVLALSNRVAELPRRIAARIE